MEGKSDKPRKKDTSGRPRIATLGSLNQQQSSDDEEGQAFYVGGSEKSGQQVLGPNRDRQDPNEVIKNVFKAAREQGAQERPPESPEQARKLTPFKGKGKKLDDDEMEGDDQVAGGSGSPEFESKPITMKLKMWKTGFSVDDGPLRTFDDPQNREFLASISRGELPSELIRGARDKQVNLVMEDHRGEEFVEPKRRVKAFAGEGYRLGNVTPETIGAPGSSSSAADNEANEEEAKKRLKLDESKPTTSIQIRLSDGSRLVVKVNLDHTIQNLRSYICDARPAYGPLPFVLMTNFPTKQLTDETQTIEDANLKNATLTQKLI